jgi:hypothetical protein
VALDPIAESLLKEVRGEVGYREKGGQLTKFGQWYADRVQDSQYRDAPWCDMFIAWAADKAGVGDYVGQFAWTPSHANWFIKQGAWTHTPEPGALVFYDWTGGKSYKGIDHVGIVESVDGKKIHTIEANVDSVWLKRKTRDTDKVVGYGLPRMVKAKADLNEIRSTEQPLVRQPQPVTQHSPMDVLGSPLAILVMMVLTTVAVSFRLAGRRRGTHRRFTWPRVTWPWNAPSKRTAAASPVKPKTPASARAGATRAGAAKAGATKAGTTKAGAAKAEAAKPGAAKTAATKAAAAKARARAAARAQETRSASKMESPLEPVHVGAPPVPAGVGAHPPAHHTTATRRRPYEQEPSDR